MKFYLLRTRTTFSFSESIATSSFVIYCFIGSEFELEYCYFGLEYTYDK